MKKLFCVLFSMSISIAAYANTPVTCKPLPNEAKKFNENDYQSCLTSIKQCPKTGEYYNNSCVVKTAEQTSTCNSVSAIAKAVNASITQLSFSPVDAYNIVTVTYPGDGQVQNYILSPKGCLVDTIVDPRKLSSDLGQLYANKEWMIVNTELPTGKKLGDGSESFNVLLRVTEDCLACTVIGWADVIFVFDAQGNLANTTLKFFGSEPIGLNTKTGINHK